MAVTISANPALSSKYLAASPSVMICSPLYFRISGKRLVEKTTFFSAFSRDVIAIETINHLGRTFRPEQSDHIHKSMNHRTTGRIGRKSGHHISIPVDFHIDMPMHQLFGQHLSKHQLSSVLGQEVLHCQIGYCIQHI